MSTGIVEERGTIIGRDGRPICIGCCAVVDEVTAEWWASDGSSPLIG